MLTSMPHGHITKTNAFCTKKMETQIFMKQGLKPNLEELFIMRIFTHLPSLSVLSLHVLVFCDLHGHLGGKAS
jgi:hypothetical protein